MKFMSDDRSHLPHPSPIVPRPSSRKWLWFFTVLGILGVTAVVIQVWYNLGQQLTPEKLAQARELWEQKRPLNYDLEYAKTGDATGTLLVQVRNRSVAFVRLDGRPILRDEKPLPKTEYYRYDMSGLFNDIAKFLEEDAKPGKPRTFAIATFDKKDGHLTRYVRSVASQKSRLEIVVQLKILADDENEPKLE